LISEGDALLSRLVTLVLVILLGWGAVELVPRLKSYPLPGNQQGYAPEQPIDFSHRLHAGELKISCLYCHFGAEQSRHAGIPASSLCMNCHRLVSSSWEAKFSEYLVALRTDRAPKRIVSPEIRKLYDSLGLDDELQPDPTRSPSPIPWVKVHNLPAYACFDHRAHVKSGVKCQQCHGPVETMDRVRQVEDLSMGWCVDCHRNPDRADTAGRLSRASTDCAVCHY
jgi:hypothetical protein